MKENNEDEETAPLYHNDSEGQTYDQQTLTSPVPKTLRWRLFCFGYFLGAFLVLFSSTLAISNWRRMNRIESLMEDTINNTEGRLGLGAPLEGEDSLEGILSKSMTSAPTLSTATQSLRPGSMATFPDSIDLVSHREPDRPYYVPQYLQELDVNVVISTHVSAVMQFTIEEDGRRDCHIGGYFPAADELDDKPANISGSPVVQIWNLTSHLDVEHRTWNPKHPLRTNLTWETRPERGNLLGALHVVMGEHPKTPVFPCPSGEKMTVELSCPSHECSVELQQVKTYPLLGFEVYSH